MALFTDFGVRGRVGILDWYTMSVAVFTIVLLSAHGATYLRLSDRGPAGEHSGRPVPRDAALDAGAGARLTAFNGAAPAHGLGLALIWWPVALVLALTYLTVILREYRGKVRPTEDTQGYS
jgi:hypothetical protein